MPKLPVLKPQEVVSRPEALGFVEVRQRGAHKQFRHPDGRGTTVPFHMGRDISPVLLRKIARDTWNVRRGPCRCECIAAEPAAAPDRG